MRTFVFLALVACSGPGAAPARPATSGAGAGGDTPVASPGGDTPVASPGGDTPVASSPTPPSCKLRIAIKCVDGVDGCIGQKTLFHKCVAADATVGPPCEQEVALACPSGQVDACLTTPPLATGHICVVP